MKKESQLEYVKKLLLNYGKVSRNHCLEQRLTRLTSRIDDLKNEGWEIEPKREKINGGTDFVYYLKSSPYRKVMYKVEGMNPIIKFEKV